MNLSVQGLHRTFQAGHETTPALIDVTFRVEPGEFVAIMGTSGSGKTTLLHSIGALDTDFQGSIRLGEADLSRLSEPDLAQLRQRHFGFVFQHFNLLDHLTVLENVLLPSFFYTSDANESPRQRAETLLARVGLDRRADARPTELSGGQKQRVAIARALFCRPSILLADEPTGSLDRSSGLAVMRLFQTLNEQDGLTLIIVTHDPVVAALARRRILMEDGRIIADELQTPRWPDVPGSP